MPFLHVPQITVLPAGFDMRSVMFGAATQMGFKVLESKVDTLPKLSAEEIKDWARSFLDLELPLEITDADSNSSPLDAIWQIYDAAKNNTGNVTPGFILMSSREGMKTISVAILERG